MEKNRKIQIYCLLAASFVIGIFGAVCLYLGITGEYNDAMGHFNVGSLFAPVVYCCLVGGPVLGIAGAVVFRRTKAPDKALPGGIAAVVVSALAAAAILYTEIGGILSHMKEAAAPISPVNAVSWLFALLATASIVTNAVTARNGNKVNPAVSLLAFTPALYCASKVLLMYFDQSIAVNSPVKLICQLAYLSYMLVFTAEAGLSLGKERLFPKYVFTLCAAVSVGGLCSVAAAAITLTGTQCAGLAGADCIAKLGLFFYTCMRFAFAANIDVTRVEKARREEYSGDVIDIPEDVILDEIPSKEDTEENSEENE